MLLPDTERVWQFLQRQPALAGFVLVGGSALALRLKHRISEDLDLVLPAQKLPRAPLDVLRLAAQAENLEFRLLDDEAAVMAFAEGGLELHDYQQNYLVNDRIRLSMFTPEPSLAKVLTGPPEPRVRVATLPELFKSKCLVSALRSKTRDWFDLYVLLRNHGFTALDYRTAFLEAGLEPQCDIGLSRLCSGRPQADDEGYRHLMPDPPSLAEMRAFFTAMRDQLEQTLAAEVASRRPR